MPGDAKLGVVLRELRTARKLTLAAVARRAGCAESLISYIETGRRQLHPWLAEKLDDIYQTGGAVVALLRGAARVEHERPNSGYPERDLLLVQLPEGGAPVPISRRELLTGLGIGALGGALHDRLERAATHLELDDDSLTSLRRAFDGFQSAARVLPPERLIAPMTSHVAVVDVLRRRASSRQRTHYAIMQARYAESLSWLSEEAGDVQGAAYWTDRAAQWAQSANWIPMVAYTFVRRSMMSISFAGDGPLAVDNAQQVLELQGAPDHVKGLAAKQMAYGHALLRDADASARALDAAMRLLDAPPREDESALGQRSVVTDDLYAIFRTTCDIYLGRGDSVIPVLEPRLDALSRASARTATITRAKLTRAYANAGQPLEACRLAWRVLDDAEAVGSLSARNELRRSVPLLRRWEKRSEVREVLHRLRPRTATTA
ncbi:transcriptional regulator with XRE-family HTH domain [Saccharothrix coeruleofusca]|uniref:helix-turn-helix domain-containing protein n=1 Tax=Saccharothrix coeruleofusca TaxID=33919 RepID=UPI001AE2653D|nr:helix-turn-helix transcriptional regulator [Saccharothrix coeruleofusca]MBP2340141.1 transcriptional regulator with XRE-family HTH domain [Saccharothrix coeruleofusca]